MIRPSLELFGYVVAAVLVFGAGYKLAQVQYTKQIAEINEGNAIALSGAQAEMREVEAKHAKVIHDIDTKYSRDIKHAKSEYDRTIASVRAGELRLRDKFTCSGQASSAAPGASMDHGAQGGGLSREDEEFLVSESARADEAVVQLQACQAVIRSDREEQQ